MKNYAKVILYAYPLFQTVGKDYEEHIRNKALLSYDSPYSAEALAEYLAGEILQMRRLEWLKAKVEEALGKLDAVERTLVAVRYFGRRKKGLPKKGTDNPLAGKAWTERTYFRRQRRLGEKLGGLLAQVGLTEAVYEREFASLEPFAKIAKYVERE